MTGPWRMFICLLVMGILCYIGIALNNPSRRTMRGVDLRLESLKTLMDSFDDGKPHNMGGEQQHGHDTLPRNGLASGSRGGSQAGIQRNSKGNGGEGVIRNNINVALLTVNPAWLFKLRLNQSEPLIHRCPHTHRTVTVKSAYLNATLARGADVVIFSRSIDYRLWDQVPVERTPNQVWVYDSAESAYKSPQVREGGRPVGFGDFRFNMSFGYYSLSDVVAPFGEYVPFKKFSPLIRELEQKTKLVAWASSHCDMQQWDRVGFVRRLSNFLPIDTFGRCGNLTLPRGRAETKVLKTYKFYLAFENSCCTEYITEKFWKSLMSYEAVPVVFGARKGEYERVAPPNSFIFAEDFDSMDHLAGYLQEVASNDKLYGRFHAWRRRGEAKLHTNERVYAFSSQESACALLEFLEKRAWKGTGPLQMAFDPYGADWLGSCEVCTQKAWLKSFDLNSDAYNPTLRPETQRPEYKFRVSLEEHRRQIAREYVENLARVNN